MPNMRTKLTVDEAMAEFSEFARVMADSAPAGPTTSRVPETFEQAEFGRFRLADRILRCACPDPTRCQHHRCRRNRICRHFMDVHAVERGERVLPPSRRSPGAWAIRHAVWVFMNSDAG